MEFDKKTHKVKIGTMNKDEAVAFLAFLQSEQLRHQEDVEDIERVMLEVMQRFDIR